MSDDTNRDDRDQAATAQVRFERLYDKLKRPIYNFFANRGCPKEEARELRQDTFLRVFEHGETFRGDSQPETWIFGIAKKVWLRHQRDRHRLKRRGIEIPIDGGDEPEGRASVGSRLATDDCPFEDAARAEESRLVYEALVQLPEIMRQCLLLRLDQELKYREIASVLQITVSQVKTNLSRGRVRLQKILDHRRAQARSPEGVP